MSKEDVILSRVNGLQALVLKLLQATDPTAGETEVDFISEQFDHGDTGSAIPGWSGINGFRVQDGMLFGSGGLYNTQDRYASVASTGIASPSAYQVPSAVFVKPNPCPSSAGSDYTATSVYADKTAGVIRPVVKLSSSDFTVRTKFNIQNHPCIIRPGTGSTSNISTDYYEGYRYIDCRATIAGLTISANQDINDTAAYNIVLVSWYVPAITAEHIAEGASESSTGFSSVSTAGFVGCELFVDGVQVALPGDVSYTTAFTTAGSGAYTGSSFSSLPFSVYASPLLGVGENELRVVSSGGYFYIYVNNTLCHTSRKNAVYKPCYVGYVIPAMKSYEDVPRTFNTPNGTQITLTAQTAARTTGAYDFKAWVSSTTEPINESGYGRVLGGAQVWTDVYHVDNGYTP